MLAVEQSAGTIVTGNCWRDAGGFWAVVGRTRTLMFATEVDTRALRMARPSSPVPRTRIEGMVLLGGLWGAYKGWVCCL